jgi:glutamate synthase domain-containing protein 3
MTGGVAVILGPTGKNFGAGMSGGIAYVYDPDKQLPGLSNADVKGDLLPVEVSGAVLACVVLACCALCTRDVLCCAGSAGDKGVRPLKCVPQSLQAVSSTVTCCDVLCCVLQEYEDVRQLKSLVQRHLKFTGSQVARHILLNWDKERVKFVKVGMVFYQPRERAHYLSLLSLSKQSLGMGQVCQDRRTGVNWLLTG